MQLELTAPCCLLLGLANVDGQICQLGVALHYPPIQLAARSSEAFSITGGRADLAAQQAERFLKHQNVPLGGEVEIEYAIPSFMGLGSAAMLGLSVASTFAALHGSPNHDASALAGAAGLLSDGEALEAHAFTHGGLLLVGEKGDLLRRQAIPIGGDERDWVWVCVLPRMPAGTPDTLEADRRAALHKAAPEIAAEAGQIVTDAMFPAVERDDIEAFARALDRVQMLNSAALDRQGTLNKLGDEDRQVLATMREHGALVCGRMAAGLGLFALVRGGGPSRAMRRALTERLGVFGSGVMASIADNAGVQLRITGE